MPKNQSQKGIGQMSDTSPLYNSRILRTYFEYIKSSYPDLDMDSILEYAGITIYEIEDQAHWFSQNQTDRFQEILIERTRNPNIAREAGRFTTSHKGMGPVKQYTLGLMSLTSVYLLMGKVAPTMSRAADIKTKKIGPNKVEIVTTPNPGVNEKPYQCENRIGVFESLAKLFTDKLADIDHPLCFHKGDDACHYIISWEKTTSIIWKRIRNYSLLLSIVISMSSFFVLPSMTWGILVILCSLITLIFTFISEYIEKKELTKTVESQGDAAKDLIAEMNIRHNNALLVQEMGKATSSILDIDKLVKTVVHIMETHIDFDRGMILLANNEKNTATPKKKRNFCDKRNFTSTNLNPKACLW
jgi:hypothetical protein